MPKQKLTIYSLPVFIARVHCSCSLPVFITRVHYQPGEAQVFKLLKDAVLSTKVVSVNWQSLVLEINLSGSWIKTIVIGVLLKAIPSILIVILFEYIFLVTDRHLLMLQSMRPWFFCTLKRCKYVIIIWSVLIP